MPVCKSCNIACSSTVSIYRVCQLITREIHSFSPASSAELEKGRKLHRWRVFRWRIIEACISGALTTRPIMQIFLFTTAHARGNIRERDGNCEKHRSSSHHFGRARKERARFAWAIFNICFVTADNSRDLISRSGDLRHPSARPPQTDS